MKKLLTPALLVLLILATGCKKTHFPSYTGGKVELYLVTSFSKLGSSLHQIDETTVVTADTPLIAYADFLSYSQADCTFELSNNAREMIKSQQRQSMPSPLPSKPTAF